MAISEDLRSVQAILGTLWTCATSSRAGGPCGGGLCAEDGGGINVMRLLCDNLSALADQVEALEAVPLAPVLTGHGTYFSACRPDLACSSARGGTPPQ